MARTDLIYGIHAVRALLERAPADALELWVQAGSLNPALAPITVAATKYGITVQCAARATLDRMANGGRHQGVVARCRARAPARATGLQTLLQEDLHNALFMVLDGVEDPQNLGACLRVADAAGARAVIRPLHRGVSLTAAAARVASGAAETVPLVAVANLARALKEMKEAGIWLVGTDAAAGKSLYETELPTPLALVMGGEGAGMRRLTREHCDILLRVPMLGAVESLNVAVCAGICLFEALRQRLAREPR
ncbi:MAG: 23S rRNA (guanosine(2251)-2'-O)-methyltransferase RlmB [Chromatiales bacterium]